VAPQVQDAGHLLDVPDLHAGVLASGGEERSVVAVCEVLIVPPEDRNLICVLMKFGNWRVLLGRPDLEKLRYG